MGYVVTEGNESNIKVTPVNYYQCEVELNGRKIMITDNKAKEYREDRRGLLVVKVSTVVVSVIFLLAFLVIVGTVGAFEYADYANVECAVTNSQAFIRCALSVAVIWCSAVMIKELDKMEGYYKKKLSVN